MELLLTLRKIELLEKVLPFIDGVICGKYFTNAYDYSVEDLQRISLYCKRMGKKFYVILDQFISEDEKMLLLEYMDLIDSLYVDGIYFHDLGVFDAARTYGLTSKLIYDGKSVMCNSLDAGFLLDRGIDSVVLSSELTLEEVTKILRDHPGRIDMRIFGHQRVSYSRRHFLSNYFREIGKEYDFLGKQTLSLVEEQRDYKMPILEDKNGTYIYTDYILTMFDELPALRQQLKRGIIDTVFIEDENKIAQICRDYRRVDSNNVDFIRDSFYLRFPDRYGTGYLYQKTNITKDE